MEEETSRYTWKAGLQRGLQARVHATVDSFGERTFDFFPLGCVSYAPVLAYAPDPGLLEIAGQAFPFIYPIAVCSQGCSRWLLLPHEPLGHSRLFDSPRNRERSNGHGQKFVHAAWESKSDVWLAENFDPAYVR
jgi:hypothetical protein